jgi:hypothetical protein
MDTGTSLIAMPNSEFYALAKKWQKDYSGVLCSTEICYTEGSCSLLAPRLKPLRFRFEGEKFFTLPPKEYLIHGEDMEVPGYCVFGIQGGIDSSLNMFIFGDVFLRSYYSIYDFEGKRVGLALHKFSSAQIEQDKKYWLVALLIGSVLVILISVGLFFYCKKRKEQTPEAE